MNPLPDIDSVFALALQHERQVNTDGTQNVNNSKAPISSSTISMHRKFYELSSKRTLCVFSGLQGHTVEKCYKKHG